MKAVFIVYNQALTERVSELLDKHNARGFTQWQDVKGRGTQTGEPHFGTHTWPAMNSAVLSIVDEKLAQKLLDAVDHLNKQAEIHGLRAFTWNIDSMV